MNVNDIGFGIIPSSRWRNVTFLWCFVWVARISEDWFSHRPLYSVGKFEYFAALPIAILIGTFGYFRARRIERTAA